MVMENSEMVMEKSCEKYFVKFVGTLLCYIQDCVKGSRRVILTDITLGSNSNYEKDLCTCISIPHDWLYHVHQEQGQT